MNRIEIARAITSIAIGFSFAAGCGDGLSSWPGGSDDDETTPVPSIDRVSRAQVSVGQPIEFTGENFLTGREDGSTEIRFDGRYLTDDGGTYPVSLAIRPHWLGEGRLLWPYFGPLDIPFSPSGDQLGEFIGEVTATNLGRAGEVRSRPLVISLRVMPSVIVRDLQPVTASCDEPSSRLLGGFAYRLVTEAVGIEPVEFSYRVRDQLASGETVRTWAAEPAGQIGAVGDDGGFVMTEVPAGEEFHVVRIATTARSAEGRTVSSDYAFGVHRPIEYIESGPPQLARIDAAEPVSGCLSSGLAGRHHSYSEQQVDTRDRQLSNHWDESWIQEHADAYSTSHEARNGIAIRGAQDETYGMMFQWRVGDAVASLGLTEAVEMGARHRVSVDLGIESGTWTVGHALEIDDTEAWAHDDSRRWSPITSSELWQVSSSESIAPEPGADIIPGMYGVWYRQASRLGRPGGVVAYNLCGQPQWIADSRLDDYSWAVAMAQADSCPPLPEPSLPDAECFAAPCD